MQTASQSDCAMRRFNYLLYFILGYVGIAMLFYCLRDTKLPLAKILYNRKISLWDKDHRAIRDKTGQFRYDTPEGTFTPELGEYDVPLTPVVVNHTMATEERTLNTVYEAHELHPMLHFDKYCSDPTTYAERHASSRSEIRPDITTTAEGDPDKTILFWNTFFTQADYHVGFEDDLFRYCHCPVRCTLTNNRSMFADADAVILHTFYMRQENTVPPTRSSRDQIFVFYLFENPRVSWDGMHDYPMDDYFNLTMTYMDHRDTDVYMPVGDIRKRSVPHAMPTVDSIRSKTLPVAWLVSNCDPFSARATYVKALQRYIQVDVYGSCGNLTCPMGDDFGADCMKNLSSKYFFYLAFENAYCDGYVTEKVYKTLFRDLVPIVYGKAHYSKMLPPNSFIDVRDFKSPKQLATYLTRLTQNPQAYLEFFKWKANLMATGDDYHRARGFCKLCQILHTPNYPYKAHFDALEYWNPAKLCKEGKEERLDVNLKI